MKTLPTDWRGKQDRMMSAIIGDILDRKGPSRLNALRAAMIAQPLPSDTLSKGE